MGQCWKQNPLSQIKFYSSQHLIRFLISSSTNLKFSKLIFFNLIIYLTNIYGSLPKVNHCLDSGDAYNSEYNRQKFLPLCCLNFSESRPIEQMSKVLWSLTVINAMQNNETEKSSGNHLCFRGILLDTILNTVAKKTQET